MGRLYGLVASFLTCLVQIWLTGATYYWFKMDSILTNSLTV